MEIRQLFGGDLLESGEQGDCDCVDEYQKHIGQVEANGNGPEELNTPATFNEKASNAGECNKGQVGYQDRRTSREAQPCFQDPTAF